MKLELRHVDCGYPNFPPVLKDANFQVESGEICCLLGPNGVGKTTLFKTILRLIKPLKGEIRIDGEDCAKWSMRRMAQTMAYVAQLHVPPFPYLVKDVVLLGRVASTGYFRQPSPTDLQVAETAMEDMGVMHLKDRAYTDISGGERQLVLIARALAQEPRLLVLDEPTASLDYGNTVRVINKVRSLKNKGLAVILTTHSPDQAFQCESNVVLLQRGEPMQFGAAATVITERNMRNAYGTRIKVIEYVSEKGRPMRMCAPVLE